MYKRIIELLKKRDVQDNIQYYILMIPTMILIFLFMYLPLFGLIIAFQDYQAGRPFFGEGVKWVGLQWFEEFVSSYYFTRILRNTIRLNVLGLLVGFCAPIIFALLLNEMRTPKTKKVIQTISYMPYFLSSVIIAGMVTSFIADDGIITQILRWLGFEANSLNANKEAFPWIYVISGVWSSFGWGSILYLSTLSGIDPGLYEAASIDGAGRLKKIWHITLPALGPLITIQFILAIGGMLGADTEKILLLYNPSVYETADVIGTYMYRDTFMGGKFSYGTASSIILSIMGFTLSYIANRISRKVTGWSMW